MYTHCYVTSRVFGARDVPRDLLVLWIDLLYFYMYYEERRAVPPPVMISLSLSTVGNYLFLSRKKRKKISFQTDLVHMNKLMHSPQSTPTTVIPIITTKPASWNNRRLLRVSVQSTRVTSYICYNEISWHCYNLPISMKTMCVIFSLISRFEILTWTFEFSLFWRYGFLSTILRFLAFFTFERKPK